MGELAAECVAEGVRRGVVATTLLAGVVAELEACEVTVGDAGLEGGLHHAVEFFLEALLIF